MTNFRMLVEILSDGGVAFIIVGGVAASAHGAVRTTLDLDVVYQRSPENLRRLAAALKPFSPYPRGAPAGLPFVWDEQTLGNGLNFTLMTELGELDLLGEITGAGSYEELEPGSVSVRLFGRDCRVIGLDDLIRAKHAAGRPKDYEALAELELLRDLRNED